MPRYESVLWVHRNKTTKQVSRPQKLVKTKKKKRKKRSRREYSRSSWLSRLNCSVPFLWAPHPPACSSRSLSAAYSQSTYLFKASNHADREILIPVSTSVTLILLYIFIRQCECFVWLETRILSLTFSSTMTFTRDRKKKTKKTPKSRRQMRREKTSLLILCLLSSGGGSREASALVHGRLRRVYLVSSLLPPRTTLKKSFFFFCVFKSGFRSHCCPPSKITLDRVIPI